MPGTWGTPRSVLRLAVECDSRRAGGLVMTRRLRLAPLAVVCFTLMAIALALPEGAARAQGAADVGLVQRVQAALANAGFDPGPADGKAGPRTRRAIQTWQRAHGYAVTGKLTREQLKSLLAVTTPTTALKPKCAELPGRYLGENHAECADASVHTMSLLEYDRIATLSLANWVAYGD